GGPAPLTSRAPCPCPGRPGQGKHAPTTTRDLRLVPGREPSWDTGGRTPLTSRAPARLAHRPARLHAKTTTTTPGPCTAARASSQLSLNRSGHGQRPQQGPAAGHLDLDEHGRPALGRPEDALQVGGAGHLLAVSLDHRHAPLKAGELCR